MCIVSINKKAERAVLGGHPWIYGEEVLGVNGEYEDGDIVRVVSEKGRFLGSGFINSASKILVRLISDNANDTFNEAFFERRLRWAVEYRQTVMGDDISACRLIFGDSDRFPGLIVDRFENVLVTQIMCLGIEKRKDMLFSLLVKILADYGIAVSVIYERNDVAVREKEGLSQYKGFYSGESDGHVKIRENGIIYDVDYINGQKTGFFLDQKYNRLAASKIARGKTVLDCFTHTGAFGLNCADAGAAHVTSVDISETAIAESKLNASLNSLGDNISYVCADVFDYLTELDRNKDSRFNYIILDPPAFTKSGGTLKAAYRGYKEINYKAMKLLPRGGYLATCSCSHFMTDELFRKMLTEAAADAKVTLRQVESRRQAPDHPICYGIPETEYLKFYIFQVV